MPIDIQLATEDLFTNVHCFAAAPYQLGYRTAGFTCGVASKHQTQVDLGKLEGGCFGSIRCNGLPSISATTGQCGHPSLPNSMTAQSDNLPAFAGRTVRAHVRHDYWRPMLAPRALLPNCDRNQTAQLLSKVARRFLFEDDAAGRAKHAQLEVECNSQ